MDIIYEPEGSDPRPVICSNKLNLFLTEIDKEPVNKLKIINFYRD